MSDKEIIMYNPDTHDIFTNNSEALRKATEEFNKIYKEDYIKDLSAEEITELFFKFIIEG